MEDKNNRANNLCAISLMCIIVPIVLFLTFGVTKVGIEIPDIIYQLISMSEGFMIIAGIVLIIYVRVRYPKNVFGKVLMWSYIVFAIIVFALFVASMIFIYILCNSMMEGCRGIG